MPAVDALGVRELVAAGRREEAARSLVEPLAAVCGRRPSRVLITSDAYSLNSVCGTVSFDDAAPAFFKFHVEEGEQSQVGEYYRAQVLMDAGLPVDMPTAMSTRPGEQLVVYPLRRDPRMVDVCRDLERRDGDAARLPEDIVSARRALDAAIGRVAVRTLRTPAGDEGARASIHQLFSHRLHDSDGHFPGGRLARWYLADPHWSELASCTWIIDGLCYDTTLSDLIDRARGDVDPVTVSASAVVTAHGDDHLGNVWCERSAEGTRLVMFDPAFAGVDIPALLALVKPTFHNVFAHPAWLYHPNEADGARVRLNLAAGIIELQTTPLSPLRQQLLDSLVEEAWIPLLMAMAERGLLDPSWRQVVRSALMLCPLLVAPLLDPARSPEIRLLGLAHVVRMGAEPTGGSDPLVVALDRMEQAVQGQ